MNHEGWWLLKETRGRLEQDTVTVTVICSTNPYPPGLVPLLPLDAEAEVKACTLVVAQDTI